jgi:hypothetical protein
MLLVEPALLVMLVLVYQWLFRQLSAHPTWMAKRGIKMFSLSSGIHHQLRARTDECPMRCLPLSLTSG